jgi:uncharacterized protein (DUF1501 family)
MTTRRQFLTQVAGSGAVLSIGAALPGFWPQALAGEADSREESILIVIQLSGGNDGLNTVVPYRDEQYYKARPTLAVPAGDVLKIDDELGFHPAAASLAHLLQDNQLAIVQGVGYPEPNRSHFESMDIWHTCQRKSEPRKTGWLGRYLDRSQADGQADVPAIHLGEEKQPLALAAEDVRVPSIGSLERFRLQGNQAELVREVNALPRRQAAGDHDLLSFVETSTTAALSASRRIEQARQGYRSSVSYPEDRFAQHLRTVAQLIEAGLRTRVYYLTLDGFDTHSQQAAAHEGLLRRWSSALQAFLADLEEHGHAQRTLVLTFSEFGRRVQENASAGTDHGAAAPVFVAGKRVQAGLHGKQPSLTDLVDGDLQHHTDFRQVYATLLGNWLGVDSRDILGKTYPPLAVV